jgi:hypothetical protein
MLEIPLMPLNVDDVDQQDSVPSEKREQDKFFSLNLHLVNSFALLYMQMMTHYFQANSLCG